MKKFNSLDIKKKIALIVVILMCIIGIMYFTTKSKTYTSEDYNVDNKVSINEIYTNADENIGKSVDFIGKVFSVDKDEDGRYLNVYTNNTYDDNVVIVAISDDKKVSEIKENDYIKVSGVEVANLEGKTQMGVDSSWPQINARTASVESYKNAVSPTTYNLNVDKEQTQYKNTISISNLEQSKNETRLNVKVENKGKDKLSIYPGDFKLIVDGKQYEEENVYDANYKELPSDIQPGVNAKATIAFPHIDLKKAKLIKLKVTDVTTYNYDNEFKDYIFNIK